MALYDRVWFATATTGTGTITVGSAVSGYRTPSDAGIPNAGTFPYVIIDGSAWEIGTGTYTSSGTTVARSLLASSTGSLLNLSGAATMFIDSIASKLPQLDLAQTWSAVQTFAVLPVLSGGGISFPATQVASADANTLDDYEEGTFTPALNFGGASVGMTYTKQEGVYTKIGRVVYLQINIVLSAKGSSTGSATITGLPFTSAASPITGGTFLASNMITVAVPSFFIGAVGTTITLQDFTGSTNAAMTNGDFNNTSELYITTFYRV